MKIKFKNKNIIFLRALFLKGKKKILFSSIL